MLTTSKVWRHTVFVIASMIALSTLAFEGVVDLVELLLGNCLEIGSSRNDSCISL